MKKKLLVLVAMLLCVVTVLASCTSSMKFEKVVGDGTYNDENPTLTTAAKLDLKGIVDVDEHEILNAKGDLIVFVDYNVETELSTYTVYNLATNATVWTGTESKTESGENSTSVSYHVELMEQWDTVLVAISTATITHTADDMDYAFDYKLLTSVGAEIVNVTDAQDKAMSEPWFVEDLFCFDGKVYRIADDGTVAHAFDWNELRGAPDEDIEKVGEFYLEWVDMGIVIYDASLNLVTTYYVPSYVGESAEAACLSNGNVLIQYSVAQDIMAEDYDYLAGMTKYNLCTLLLNAESGKLKELKADWVLADDDVLFDEGDGDWIYNEKIENIVWVTYIVDQRVDNSKAAVKMVSMTNKGKIAGVIDNLIPNMDNDGLWHVATNRWIATNLAGQSFLLNEKGEVLGEVTGLDESKANASFFVLNSKIYDWDLNVKLNLVEQKCDDYEILEHSVWFENEDGEQKLYINGEVKTLIDKAAVEADKRDLHILSDALYVIIDTATEGTVKYELYNDAGTLLTTVDNANFGLDCIVYTADSNNAVLIVGADAELKPVYYRVG